MKLYLVQHGDAVSKDLDPERPLSDLGRHDLQRMAGFLGQLQVRVDRILHSGKTRAEQSAVILAHALLPNGQIESVFGLAPNDPVEAFAATLAARTGDTLLVGHLPFMARLAAWLLVGDAERQLLVYRPGSVACLERNESGDWHLNWMLRPELLQSGQ